MLQKQRPEIPQGQDSWAAATACLVEQPVGTLFTLTNPARRETKTLMFEGITGGSDPSQRVVLARGGAVDQVIRITSDAFHAGAVADITVLPPDAQVDVRDIWDHLATAPTATPRAGPTALEKLVQQASAFKPGTKLQVRQGEEASWETVTLVSATSGTPAVGWAKGNIDYSQTFTAANADEAGNWQIRAEVRPPLTWVDYLLICFWVCCCLGFLLDAYWDWEDSHRKRIQLPPQLDCPH
jgi:hypothetical protein